MQRPADRRGVTGHAKPMFIAAAPMELIMAGSAPDRRLLGYFACNSGGANEHQYRKSAPAQRQRKENGSVLAKECSAVSARRPKVIDAPLWRIFFGGHPVSFVRKQKKWGGKKPFSKGHSPLVFGYFLQEQKVTRPQAKPTLSFFLERKAVAGLPPLRISKGSALYKKSPCPKTWAF